MYMIFAVPTPSGTSGVSAVQADDVVVVLSLLLSCIVVVVVVVVGDDDAVDFVTS